MGKPKRALIAALAAAAAMGTSPAYALDATCTIEYSGGAQAFATSAENILGATEELLPGDVLAGSFAVTSTAAVPAEIFISTRDTATDGPADTLDRMTIKLATENSGTIYEGPFSGIDGNEAVSLGEFDSGDRADVSYEIGIPAELPSEYENASIGTAIVLTAMEQPDEAANLDGSSASASLGKTGDAAMATAIGAASLAVMATMAAALAAWRRRSRAGDHGAE